MPSHTIASLQRYLALPYILSYCPFTKFSAVKLLRIGGRVKNLFSQVLSGPDIYLTRRDVGLGRGRGGGTDYVLITPLSFPCVQYQKNGESGIGNFSYGISEALITGVTE